MSFKSTLRLDSPLFDREKRKAAGSRAVMKTAREFKESTRRKMVESKPSGKLYRRERGAGFSRSHRASRPGERPAVVSGNFSNSGKVKRISTVEVEVTIGENLPYTEKLAKTRQIVTKNDRLEAQRQFDKNAAAEFSKLRRG